MVVHGGNHHVTVVAVAFPVKQSHAQHKHMFLIVTNTPATRLVAADDDSNNASGNSGGLRRRLDVRKVAERKKKETQRSSDRVFPVAAQWRFTAATSETVADYSDSYGD